jgi:hypothetical protein
MHPEWPRVVPTNRLLEHARLLTIKQRDYELQHSEASGPDASLADGRTRLIFASYSKGFSTAGEWTMRSNVAEWKSLLRATPLLVFRTIGFIWAARGRLHYPRHLRQIALEESPTS